MRSDPNTRVRIPPRRRRASPAAQRRRRERLAHRRAMLEAAEHVFGERGFERTTMEAVAERAEFSVGALYNFFPSKEALFGEVLEKIACDFVAEFRAEIERAPTPLDALRAVVNLQFKSFRAHGSFFRSVIAVKPGSATCPEVALPRECRALYDRYIEDLAAVFRKAMARGQVRRVNPLYAALALEGVVHAYAAYWHRQGLEVPLEEEVRAVWRNFLGVMTVEGRGHVR